MTTFEKITVTRHNMTATLPIPAELHGKTDELDPPTNASSDGAWNHSEKLGISAQLAILSETEQEENQGGGEAASVHDWWMDDGIDDPDPAQIIGTEKDYALRSICQSEDDEYDDDLDDEDSEPTLERHARRFTINNVAIFAMFEHSYPAEPTWREAIRECLGNIVVSTDDGTVLFDRTTAGSASNPLDHAETEYEPQ